MIESQSPNISLLTLKVAFWLADKLSVSRYERHMHQFKNESKLSAT